MATATYGVSVKSVGKNSIDLVISDLFDGHLWLDPTLVIRTMSEPLGLGDELYDHDQIEGILAERFTDLSLLQTKKQDGVFRIGLSSDDLSRFSKGESWESYDYGSARNTIVGIAFSDDSKTAITGYFCDVFPAASSAAIESVTKKGFGSVKRWLHHPDLVAVGATSDGWWTAGGTVVRFWNATGAKMLSQVDLSEKITACCGTFAGTENGAVFILPGGESVAALNESIASICFAGDHLAVGTKTGLYVGTADELISVALPSSPTPVKVSINSDGEWLAAAGAEEGWRGLGTSFEADSVVVNETIAFWSVYDVAKVLRGDVLYNKSSNSQKIYRLDTTSGDVTEWGEVPFPVDMLRVSDNGRCVATGSGHPIQQVAVSFDGRLVVHDVGPYKIGFSPSADPALSPSGHHVAFSCEKGNSRDGFTVVFDSQTGHRVELPNPNAGYDFIWGIGFLDDKRLLVAYGNHDAVVWSVTGEQLEILSFRAGTILPFENVLAIGRDNTINFWIDGEDKTTVPVGSNAYLKMVTRDGQRVLMGEPESMVIFGLNEEPWVHEKTAGGSSLSANGKWFVRAPKTENWDDPIAPELYDVDKRSLVRTLPEGEATQLFVRDDGTVWVMDANSITVYPPKGDPRVITSPPPRDIAQTLVGAIWASGEPRWLVHNPSRVVSGAVYSPKWGLVRWGLDRRWF